MAIQTRADLCVLLANSGMCLILKDIALDGIHHWGESRELFVK